MSWGGIIFWAAEARISEIEEEARIRWMDIQWPLLPEPCVDYKLKKPCIHANLHFFRGRVNLVGPQVCGREHIAHLRLVRMYNPFLNSNGIYYNLFTIC